MALSLERARAHRVRLHVIAELLASRAWRTWQRDWLVACARARQERNGTGRVQNRAPLSTPPPKKFRHQARVIRLTPNPPRGT